MISMKKFFTLIELLAVVGIIGVLAGLLIPALKKAQESARSTSCRNNLHGVGTAFQMYLQESKDIMPNAAQMPSLNLNTDPPIRTLLEGKISTAKALKCPSDFPGGKYYVVSDTDDGYSTSEGSNSQTSYFDRESGSSYEYNSMLGGRQLKDMSRIRRWGETKVWVMKDYAAFHGKPGALGACNFLFSDWHAGDIK